MRNDPKLNFEEALDRIQDERYLEPKHVRADALSRKVWVAEWHIPGCMSESRSYCLTKADAINAVCRMAGDEMGDGPRGMKTALRKCGRFDCSTDLYGSVINTIERVTLADIL